EERLKSGWEGYEKEGGGSRLGVFGLRKEVRGDIKGVKEKLKGVGLSEKEICDGENRYKN
ncbi:hypothetical protein, partial [Staphylococcus epidermidis]|uniref:hypothetical protein n=1 Tax=Staphylococcus epidermidis TaxID=1282 RepID=UPI001643080E